jgi:predicted nuclease of predicted toxin-antitoxin system
MRLLIDEDTAVQLIEPLRHVLFGHDVMHISGLSWKGKKDLQVLPDAKNAGFDALITKDRASSTTRVNAPRSRNRDCITSATHSAWREYAAWRWP